MHRRFKMTFSYNIKNGNIYADDKHIVYWEKVLGVYRCYIKKRGNKQYIQGKDLEMLKSTLCWFEQNQGCDFDGLLNKL